MTGDEVGLRQVVGNLMSNAMTHTPDGTPIEITIRSGALGNGHRPKRGTVRLRATRPQAGREQGGEPAVILEVTDHGAGLTTEQQEHVFERFYRTDRARSRTAGGTGLGLAIVAAMVGAHNGRVWVDSEPGKARRSVSRSRWRPRRGQPAATRHRNSSVWREGRRPTSFPLAATNSVG